MIIKPAKTWILKVGDKGELGDMDFTVQENDGETAVVLTGYTIIVIATKYTPTGDTELFAGNGTITDASEGEFRYRPVDGDIDTAGEWSLEIQLYKTSTDEQYTLAAGNLTTEEALDYTAPTTPSPAPTEGSIETSDSSFHTINTFTVDDGKAYTFYIHLTAMKDDETKASGYGFKGSFKSTGGVITQIGITHFDFGEEEEETWDAKFTIGSGEVYCQVNSNGDTVQWDSNVWQTPD